MKQKWPGVILVLGLFFATSRVGWAQETTGTFFGVTRDVTGAALAGVTVTATNVDTRWSRSTVSDEQGNYILTLLPIGRYEITAEFSGFKKAVRSDILLHVGERLNVNFTLEIGQVSETMQVTAALTRVNTQDGGISELLGSREIALLPINGRYLNQLVPLMPGTVSFIPQGPTTLAFNRAGVAVNGMRPNSNNWSIDGVYNMDTGAGINFNSSPAMDTVAEFRLMRTNYDAEYGTTAGGHVNLITKSGSSDFHGGLYEFFRNDALDARNFFSQTGPSLRFNNFGFTAGGPAWIPGVYNRQRDKTFFFASMEWQRIRRGTTFAQVVPTEAQRRGDFSAVSRTIRDPETGQPFPGNQVPSHRIDPNAIALSRLIPLPNRQGEVLNWAASPVLRIDYREDLLRIDHKVSPNTEAMLRFSHNTYFFRAPLFSGFPELVTQRDSTGGNLGASVITSFSPTLQNELVFGYTWNKLPTIPVGNLDPKTYGVNIPQLFPDTPQTYPLQSMRLDRIIPKVPNLSFTGYGSFFIDNAWNNGTDIWQFKDNLSKIVGRHSLKFGVLVQREWKFEPANINVEGAFSFNGRYTGDAYADFLLGRAFSYAEPNTVIFLDHRRATFEGYFNDRWKATRQLSLSLGARYSYFQIPEERDQKYRVFDPARFDPLRALRVTSRGELVPGSGDPLNGLVEPSPLQKNHPMNFAPRVSFSWDPWGTGLTVVHGGYGLFYNREVLAGFIFLAGNPPLAMQQTVFDTFLSNPGGGTTRSFPPDIRSIDPDQKVPSYQQWSLGVQRELFPNTVLDIGYVGTKGAHLLRTVNRNQPLPSLEVARGQISANTVRPFQGFGDILQREQSYSSNYHSLQVSLSRNFHRGLALQLSYTVSKAIDTADYPGYTNPGANRRDLRLERGPASFDLPQIFVASFVWELPMFRDQRGLSGKLLGGWQLSGITRFSSGQPVDVTLGRDIAGVGGGLQRPQIVGDPRVPSSERGPDRMFRREAFVEPPLGTFATTSRNPVRGPGINNWDVSLMKSLRLRESTQVEFRADFFNLFNHTQFASVGTSFYAPSFGRATSARLPREIQLGLKLSW